MGKTWSPWSDKQTEAMEREFLMQGSNAFKVVELQHANMLETLRQIEDGNLDVPREVVEAIEEWVDNIGAAMHLDPRNTD